MFQYDNNYSNYYSFDFNSFYNINTFKYHVFEPMGRFQLELVYLYFPPSFHLTVVSVDGTTVENKGKLILIKTMLCFIWHLGLKREGCFDWGTINSKCPRKFFGQEAPGRKKKERSHKYPEKKMISVCDYWSWDFHNFKCGLGLQRGPPSHVRTIG